MFYENLKFSTWSDKRKNCLQIKKHTPSNNILLRNLKLPIWMWFNIVLGFPLDLPTHDTTGELLLSLKLRKTQRLPSRLTRASSWRDSNSSWTLSARNATWSQVSSKPDSIVSIQCYLSLYRIPMVGFGPDIETLQIIFLWSWWIFTRIK